MKRDLYFIQREVDQAIKIGRSSNVEVRLKALQSAHGICKIVLVQPNAGDAESSVHSKLCRSRVQDHSGAREWFRPTEEVLNFIQTLRNGVGDSTPTEWRDLLSQILRLRDEPEWRFHEEPEYTTIRIQRPVSDAIARLQVVIARSSAFAKKPSKADLFEEAFKAYAKQIDLPWEE